MTRLTVLMFARARELVDASSIVLDLAPDPRGFAGAEGKRERDDA